MATPNDYSGVDPSTKQGNTRINSAAWALAEASAGERVDFRVPRGLFGKKLKKGETPVDLIIVQTSWLQFTQAALSYEFEDSAILEEALESEGSGVASVGEGSKTRSFDKGNTALARLGDVVVRAVQADIAYRARISEDDAAFKVKALLKTSNLVKLGRKTKLHTVVRPPMPPSEKQKKSLFSKVTKKVDRNKLLAEAVLAVIAAVYMDSGFDAVKRVILTLHLFNEKRD